MIPAPLLSDFLALLRLAARTCRVGDCGQLAAFRVSWSDRDLTCCEPHLAAARRAAADDSGGDRTDNPRVRPITQLAEVERYAAFFPLSEGTVSTVVGRDDADRRRRSPLCAPAAQLRLTPLDALRLRQAALRQAAVFDTSVYNDTDFRALRALLREEAQAYARLAYELETITWSTPELPRDPR